MKSKYSLERSYLYNIFRLKLRLVLSRSIKNHVEILMGFVALNLQIVFEMMTIFTMLMLLIFLSSDNSFDFFFKSLKNLLTSCWFGWFTLSQNILYYIVWYHCESCCFPNCFLGPSLNFTLKTNKNNHLPSKSCNIREP